MGREAGCVCFVGRAQQEEAGSALAGRQVTEELRARPAGWMGQLGLDTQTHHWTIIGTAPFGLWLTAGSSLLALRGQCAHLLQGGGKCAPFA